MLENQFIFEPSHFENNNYYNLNITNFFNKSRKINFFCNQYLHQYFSLLRVLKRHHFSQQDIFLHVVKKSYGYLGKNETNVLFDKADKSIALNLLFNYYKQFKYESKTFNEDLNINIGNVYFDNKIIDEELSEFFNRKIKLNYDSFYQYVNKNLSLLKQHFDFNIEKNYSEDEFDIMLLDYAKKQLDNI